MARHRYSFGLGGGQPSPLSAVPGHDTEAEDANFLLCVTSPNGRSRDYSFWKDSYNMKLFAQQRVDEGCVVTVWKRSGTFKLDKF